MTTTKTGRFGHCDYARMLAHCKAPASVQQLVERTGTAKQTVREILWRMERLRLVRVDSWVEPTTRSAYLVPMFVIGEGESAQPPANATRRPIGGDIGRPRSELIAFAHMIRLLREGATRNDLHEQTGVAYMRVSNLLRELRRLGLLHTTAWRCRDDGTGRPAEVLMFGAGRNAPRPPTISRAQIQQATRQRRRALESMRTMISLTAANMPTAREAA